MGRVISILHRCKVGSNLSEEVVVHDDVMYNPPLDEAEKRLDTNDGNDRAHRSSFLHTVQLYLF